MSEKPFSRDENGTLIDAAGNAVLCKPCGNPITIEHVELFGHVMDWNCYANAPVHY